MPCIAFTQDQVKIDQVKIEKLTEIQTLKADNFKLRVQLTQCNATLNDRNNKLDSINLTEEQKKLEQEFRETLHAKETDKFDWSTLSFSSTK